MTVDGAQEQDGTEDGAHERGAHERGATEDGFTLIEVIVASLVFAVGAGLVLTLVVTGLATVRSTTTRSSAAAIASAQIESVQGIDVQAITDGRTSTTKTVGATTYTIVQDASYLPVASSTNACATNGTLAYKRVTVTVTWPRMGTTAPVTESTLRSLGLADGDLTSTDGAAAVQVETASGAGVANIAVTLARSGTTAGTLTTGDDGCVVFAGLTPGTFTASVNTAGYVDAYGDQSSTGTAFSVTAGALATTSLLYDVPGALAVTPVVASGATAPTLPITLRSALWSGSQLQQLTTCGSPLCVSGTSTRTASSLMPGSYQAWAGTCLDSIPSSTPNTAVTASTTASTTVPTGTVTVRAYSLLLYSTAGRAFYAEHPADTRCTAGESYALGSLPSSSSGSVTVALPYGTWYLQLTNSTSSVQSTQVVTLSASAPTATVVVAS